MFSKRAVQMKPPPPPTLSKEFARVWVGWCQIGDREVAREAAAKGIYIPLALQFIATRKDWDHSDVERWFKSEILTWTYQLLDQRQIFKASHILANIGLDPPEQLGNVLLETKDRDLRDYIGGHLSRDGKLEASLLNTWLFMKSVEASDASFGEEISQASIQTVELKSREWKSTIATVLFFDSYDFCLESFLTTDSAWKFLLAQEKSALLKLWINVYFSKNLQYACALQVDAEILQRLKNLFLLWDITSQMINEVDSEAYSAYIRDLVLNELAVYGIFNNAERNDVVAILGRFTNTQNIQNLHNILQEPTSHLNISEFYEKLNCFCVTHELYELLGSFSVHIELPAALVQQSKNAKQFALWLARPEPGQHATSEVLLKNAVTALRYFADDDIVAYLTRNPIILLALIMFTKETLSDIITQHASVTFADITLDSETILGILKNLPTMQSVLGKFSTHTPTSTVSLQYLLEKHLHITGLFTGNRVPHFGDATLSHRHGHVDEVNYLYYVKQNRPGKAVKVFLLDKFHKNGQVSDADRQEASANMTKLVLRNCDKPDTVSSCIAFAEMLGSPTNDLRVLVSVFDAIKATHYDLNELRRMFANVSENASQILDIYEGILLEKCEIHAGENHLDPILNDHEIALHFATMHRLDLPIKFLLYCAKHNLWLPFAIFIQIFNYPAERILKLTSEFENKNMADHLYHAFANDIDLSDEDLLTASIGQLSRSISSQTSSVDLDGSASENMICDLPPNTDLLRVLITCHKSGDPPTALLQACQSYKHPLLAILATCYEPDSVIINWLTWLSVSTGIDIDDVVENYSGSATAVSELLATVLRKEYARTLMESFRIFLPDNPLNLLVDFLHGCILLNFETSLKSLTSFENQVRQLNYNPAIPANDFEYTFLTNSYWLIDTAFQLIFATLGHCLHTKSHQITFLNTLCHADFTRNVPIECPNFCNISELVQKLSASDIDLNLGLFFEPDARKSELIRCIELLVQRKQYEHALAVAKYENLCVDYVLNEEWSHKFKYQLNDNFWQDCDTAFQAAGITPCSAAEFYVYCCKMLTDCSEKYRAIKLAYEWLKKSDHTDKFVENVEQEIWSSYFALDDGTLTLSHYAKHETNYLLSEIQERSNASTRCASVLNEDQLRHLAETIGKILESGDVCEAVRLGKIFDYRHAEVEILRTCYELAEGKLSPYEISAEQRLLFLNRDRNLRAVTHRRRTVKSSRSNMSTASCDSTQTMVPIAEQDEPVAQDTLALLETMSDRLQHGGNIGGRILMCYRIALNVNKPYQDVVKHTDSFALLRAALDGNCANKLEVVHDVFVVFQWSKTEITDFIFDELRAAISMSIGQHLDCILMWDLNLDNDFHLVLQFCSENSSVLGEKLFAVTNTMQLTHGGAESEQDSVQISVLIELLIRAHDCFNTYCNMEGIAAVLRKAQTLTSILLNRKHWHEMVRLLTGIGRYTEMNYIFQILKENDQFEYLLKRNFRKNHGLKVALLKFLRRHCPKNQDLYRIVALHFTLFSEVAQLWENEAAEMLTNLIEIAKLEAQNQGRNFELQLVLFTNSGSTLLCLDKIMTNHSHAAEFHLHGKRLKQAMRAAQEAELLALQISMLKCLPADASVDCLLQLSQQQVHTVIMGDLSFPQTKILTESYNCQVDWGAVLYQQCVQSGKLHYLDDFLTAKPLTNTLVQDLTRRFLADSKHSATSVRAMKEILKRLGSVHMRYRLASELGFTDVIETLLNGSQLAYLKDTVWKRGYKQS